MRCHDANVILNLTSSPSLPLQSSEADLPVCSPNSVCNKIDTYGTPWVEKQCRCPSPKAGAGAGAVGQQCSTSTHPKDGHTVVDRTRLYKVSRRLFELEQPIPPYMKMTNHYNCIMINCRRASPCAS